MTEPYVESMTPQETPPQEPKKKFYQKTWFIILLLVLFWPVGIVLMWLFADWEKVVKIIISVFFGIILIFAIAGGGNDTAVTDDSNDKATVEETTEATEATEETTEAKTPQEVAFESGQTWFQMIDWDNVFKYKSDVHYVMDYNCCASDNPDRGEWVATAGADLQNGLGAEFKSQIKIYMDKDGIAQSVYYYEADGTETEIPMENIPTKF